MEEEPTPRGTIFNLKPYHILLQLDAEVKSYASELNTKCDTTYSHAVKVLNRLESHGLIRSRDIGRKKVYKLTDEGKDLVNRLKSVEEFFDSDITEETKFSSGNLEDVSI